MDRPKTPRGAGVDLQTWLAIALLAWVMMFPEGIRAEDCTCTTDTECVEQCGADPIRVLD